VFDINREHPEYVAQRPMRRQYQDMYVGGVQLKAHADLFVISRQ
jgi:hypothetical protein